jgi:hypothetical protein
MTYSIHVKGKGNRPVTDVSVAVHFGNTFNLHSDSGETDDDGRVTFSNDIEGPKKGRIFVQGYQKAEKTIQDDGNYTVHYHSD